MYVNGVCFINTISFHIKSTAAENVANIEAINLQNSIKQVKCIYMQSGFKVVNILIDVQFGWIHGQLSNLHIHLNICSKNDHVKEIEWLKRKIKERDREIYNTISLQNLLGRMIVEFTALVVFCLNVLPPSPSISGEPSRRKIITGMIVEYTKNYSLQFSEYAQVHKSNDNMMQDHMMGAIDLCPTGKTIGAYYFMILTTGICLNHQQFNTLPL